MLTTVTGEGIGAPNISTGSSGHDNSIAYTTNDPSIFFLDVYLSLNRVSFLPPPVRNNIFYEIETLGLGPPICPLF
jgi:hypothetical protein